MMGFAIFTFTFVYQLIGDLSLSVPLGYPYWSQQICHILAHYMLYQIEMLILLSYNCVLLLLMVGISLQQCESSCLKCNSSYNIYSNWRYQCTCGKTFHYLDQNGTCQTCPFRCKECTGINFCTSCYTSAVLFGSNCLWDCPDGYEQVNGGCSLKPKLSTAAIVGITIGSIIAGIILIYLLAHLLWNRYFANRQQPRPFPQAQINPAERLSQYLWQSVKGAPNEITTEQINVVPSIKDQQRQGSKEVCSVCLEPQLNTVPECGHALHLKCLSEWMRRSSLCPLCRAEIGREITIICLRCNRSRLEWPVAWMTEIMDDSAHAICPQCRR